MQSKIHQAIILSAGFGTRLLTLTRGKIPKAMISLSGKPLLERHIEQFKKCGVTEFFINLFYLPDAITDYFGDGSKWSVRITYIREPEIRGTAGGVKNFGGVLRDNFFVIYSDIYSEVDYGAMANAFAEKPGAIGMELVGITDHPEDSDLAEVAADLRFLKIHLKPHKVLPTTYKSMRGIYVLNEKILKYIPPKTYYEIDHDLLPDVLAKGGRFYGYECNEYLKDIGTPERFLEVEKYLGEKKASE